MIVLYTLPLCQYESKLLDFFNTLSEGVNITQSVYLNYRVNFYPKKYQYDYLPDLCASNERKVIYSL